MLGFLLNFLLVQKLIPDFAALVERLAGLTTTKGLSAVLLAVMLTIKWWS